MKKENILTYLEKALEKQLDTIDFGLDWDTRNHRIEVLTILYAENAGHEMIEDAGGIASAEDYLEFEDSFIFYEESSPLEDVEQYLVAIPFNRKKGISSILLETVAEYFNEILIDGQKKLEEFASNDEVDVFELTWDSSVFEEKLAHNKKMKKDEKTLAYPRF